MPRRRIIETADFAGKIGRPNPRLSRQAIARWQNRPASRPKSTTFPAGAAVLPRFSPGRTIGTLAEDRLFRETRCAGHGFMEETLAEDGSKDKLGRMKADG